MTYQSQGNAATQLIEKAKNRMVKFYRPNLYKEAPKRELTDEEKIYASSGRSDMIATDAPQMIAGTTQTVYVQLAAVPAPPPETSARKGPWTAALLHVYTGCALPAKRGDALALQAERRQAFVVFRSALFGGDSRGGGARTRRRRASPTVPRTDSITRLKAHFSLG